ncbi:hypothetical protein TrST_g3612 [Triparma strigata]|uniref:Uncharacterized protein n=1 Tax=Triparma strigata TaxID=1606541 RepID=A0A9W7BGA9_9STRA|nr:hypothetical protein TrST_g3612 [Triparma strigata]
MQRLAHRVILLFLSLFLSSVLSLRSIHTQSFVRNVRSFSTRSTISLSCLSPSTPSTPKASYLQNLKRQSIKLHTSEQLGKKPSSSSPAPPRPPPVITKETLKSWLITSHNVHESFDLRATSLPGLDSKILSMCPKISSDLSTIYGLDAVPSDDLGSGYSEYLKGLDDERWMVHYYNFKFAHFAGGKQIYKMIQLQTGVEGLRFYEEVEGREGVKGMIEKLGEGWKVEEEEVGKSFEWAGKVMRVLME